MSNVPEGYKQTEVGVIPEDWDVKVLGDLADIQRGASPRPIDSPKWFDSESTVGWVRITDVTQSKTSTLTATTEYLSQAGIANSRYLPAGSLIMSICATVGVPVITAIDTCIHDGFVGFSKLKSVTKEYAYVVLSSLTKEFQSMGQTGSQANLNSDLVRGHKIPLPPLPEQRAIAEALADADALIAAQERLIAKKQAIKQGAMQELLTGRKRLEGFEGEWEEVRLGDIATVKSGVGFPEAAQGNREGAYPFIKVSDMNLESNKKYIVSANNWVSESEIFKYSSGMVEPKSIVFAKVGAALSLNKRRITTVPTLIDNNMASLTPTLGRASLDFMFALMLRTDLTDLSQSGALPSVNATQLRALTFTLPPLPEQQAIASILSDMDSEIAQLEQELGKLRALKQGMMQELLTGRVRLVGPQAKGE